MNGKRKFFLTSFALIASVGLCYLAKISGSEFVTVVSLSLGMYKVANIVDKKLGGAG